MLESDLLQITVSLYKFNFQKIMEICITKKLNSVAFSPQANYTDRATAAYQLLRIESVAWSAQRIPPAVNSVFLDRSRYFSFK
jgi:hypothetical protein